MRCAEVVQPHRNLLAAFRLNVANPVGFPPKTVYHDDLGYLRPVLNNFQYGVPSEAGPTADMRE